MGRRTLLLVAAVLLAAIGTGVLFLYVKATQSALGGRGGGDGTTSVLVPVQTVPAGARITASMEDRFERVEVPIGLVGPGKLVSEYTYMQGKVTTQALPAFVPVSETQFGGAVKQDTELEIPTGKMALTIDVDDAARVSSFLKPGLEVALFVVDPDNRPDPNKHQARLVLPKVTVLTTGTSGTIVAQVPRTTGTAQRGSQSLVTLLVTQQQAGTILVAKQAGALHLALLGADTTPVPQTFNDELINVPAPPAQEPPA